MKLKLSAVEEYFFYRSKLNLHSCFYVGIKLNKLPEKCKLIAALKYTVAQHERLSCNILCNEQDNKVYLQNIAKPFVFDDVVEYLHDWNQLKENEINYIFQMYNFSYREHRPLWKILVIPNQNQMLLLTDHVLMDGISAVHFWETFMEGLQKHNPVELDETIYKQPPSPPTDQISTHPYMYWPIPWKWRIIRQLASKIYYWFPRTIIANSKSLVQFSSYSFPKDLLDAQPTEETDTYKVKNTNHQWEFQLSPAHLQNLLQECKANNTSLTSLLGSLVCLSFERTTRDDYNGTFLKMEVPMNTRHSCEEVLQLPSDDELAMGNFVAPIEFKHELHQDHGIWDTASQIQETIKSSSTDKIIDTINEVKLLEVVSPQQVIEDKITLNSVPSSTFEITNLGFQAFKETCDINLPFHIVDAIFNEPQGISAIFTLSVISTPVSGLHCCVSYPKTLTEELRPNWEYMKEYLNL